MTLPDLAKILFSKLMCLKKEDIKELDADLEGGDCDVEGEIHDPKDDVSLAT